MHGRQWWGTIHYYKDGSIIYWARRDQRNLYRRLDAWALDLATLAELKRYGVQFAGVQVLETGDRYLARLADWENPAAGAVKLRDSEAAIDRDYVRRHGDRWQWYLPRAAMKALLAPADAKAATTLAKMRL